MSDNQQTTKAVILDGRDEAVLLLGNRDQNFRMLKENLDARLVARGDTIQVTGSEEQVAHAGRVIDQLRHILASQGTLSAEDIRSVLSVIPPTAEREGAQNLAVVDAGRFCRPRTDGQAHYVRALQEKDLVLCIGPAGSGKTYLAVAMAVTLLRAKAIKRIVLVRPAVEAGERLGFLPGDLTAKINPYLRPLFDALADFMEPEQLKRYLENNIIEILPLAYMRGRTLNGSIIILDEGQNASIAQMKMFLTRMGNNSKIIITGDVTQVDLPPHTRSGLIDAVHRLRDIDGIAVVHLSEKDIVRHPLVQKIVRAYEETDREKGRRKKEKDL
jgi:phosphate starvation-inducible PhoH-like protein